MELRNLDRFMSLQMLDSNTVGMPSTNNRTFVVCAFRYIRGQVEGRPQEHRRGCICVGIRICNFELYYQEWVLIAYER